MSKGEQVERMWDMMILLGVWGVVGYVLSMVTGVTLYCWLVALAGGVLVVTQGWPRLLVSAKEQASRTVDVAERRAASALQEDAQWVAYRQVIDFRVSSHTKWDANRVEQFMASLFGISRPMNLLIRASDRDIQWSVEVGTLFQQSVMNSLRSFYPQAEITIHPKTRQDFGYYRHQLESATPYIGPLKHATDFKGKGDPLAVVVGAMSNLEVGEEIVYELILGPAHYDYMAIGEKLLTTSMVLWSDYLTLEGARSAEIYKSMGADQVQRYTNEVDKAARQKLNAPLKEAHLYFKIKAASKGRADSLAQSLMSAFSIYDEDGLSYLVEARNETFPLVLSAPEVAALWHPPTEDIKTQGVDWLTGAIAPIPRPLTKAAEDAHHGIELGTNTYQGRTETVRLAYPDRSTHVNIIGRTRLGKSTLMHRMIHQDIRNGKGVGVIDPHGDLIKEILAKSIPEKREQDVVLFDVTDTDYPVGLNLFSQPSGVDRDAAAGQILGVIRKIFADNWSATRMEDVLYACITSLLAYPGATIQDIPKLLSNQQFRGQVISKVEDLVAKEFWMDEFEPLSPAYQLEIARPINSRMRRFYRNPPIRRIICQKSSLDFRKILNARKIFLANLGGLSGVESETLGALLISKIQMAAMSRGGLEPSQRVPFYLYVDEVQNFITTTLPVIFSEAAKFGLNLVTANQFLKQLEGATLTAMMGNVGTTIMFGIGPDDAPVLSKFVQPNVSGDDLMKLDRGQTVVRIQLHGQALDAFSMQTFPPLEVPTAPDEAIQRIRASSRAAYARPRDEVDRELDERYESGPPQDVARDKADDDDEHDEFAE